MTAIPIVPLQLSLKSMVLLRQIFLSIMIRVSPSVAPFKCFMSWHVYVLEMIAPPVRSVTPRPGDGEGSVGGVRVGETRHRRHQRGTNSSQVDHGWLDCPGRGMGRG